MRGFAWFLVVLGLLVAVLSVPWAIEETRVRWEAEKAYMRDYPYSYFYAGRGRFGTASPIPGMIAGAVISGFGVLLLALRPPIRAEQPSLTIATPDPADMRRGRIFQLIMLLAGGLGLAGLGALWSPGGFPLSLFAVIPGAVLAAAGAWGLRKEATPARPQLPRATVGTIPPWEKRSGRGPS